jgi:hypothetical protein
VERTMTRNRRKDMENAINELIVARRFQVARQGKDVCLIKMVSKRPVTIWLRDQGNGFYVEPSKYEFHCKNSHFEFAETENRYTRRKDILISLVEHLHKTKMWEFILNKSFFTPNPHNATMKRKVVADQYYSVTGIKSSL